MYAPRAVRPATPVPNSGTRSQPSTFVRTTDRHLEAAGGDLWLARCLALADNDAAPLPSCAARWLTPHGYDEPLRTVELFALPSRSQPGRTHLVRYHAATVTVTLRCLSLEEALETLCDVGYSGRHVLETGDLVGCIAGSFGRPCRHAGSVALWLIERKRALSDAGLQAQRDYEQFAEWLEKRGY